MQLRTVLAVVVVVGTALVPGQVGAQDAGLIPPCLSPPCDDEISLTGTIQGTTFSTGSSSESPTPRGGIRVRAEEVVIDVPEPQQSGPSLESPMIVVPPEFSSFFGEFPPLGFPFPGFPVPPDDQGARSTTSSVDGSYQMERVQVGNWLVTASVPSGGGGFGGFGGFGGLLFPSFPGLQPLQFGSLLISPPLDVPCTAGSPDGETSVVVSIDFGQVHDIDWFCPEDTGGPVPLPFPGGSAGSFGGSLF